MPRRAIGPRVVQARTWLCAIAASAVLLAAACDGETDLDLKKERDFKPGTLESPREEAN